MSSLEHAASFPASGATRTVAPSPRSSQVGAADAPTAARRAPVGLAVAGAAAAVVLALYGSPVGTPARSPGAEVAEALGAAPRGLAANRLAALAAVSLLLLWLLAVRRAARGGLGVRAAAGLGLLWATPLVLAGPLLSADLHSYLAYGRVAAHGWDPYTVPPSHLGPAALAGVDARWRGTPSVYGPVALGLFRLAVAAGPAAALVLRLIVLAALAGSVAFVAALAVPDRRPLAVAGWGLSPVAVVFLAGGGHVDAVIALLAAAALWAHRRGHPLVAVALAALAADVKLPAALLVLALLAAAPPRRLPARVAVAAGAFALPSLWLPDPLGVLRADAVVASGEPGAGLGNLVAGLLRLPLGTGRAVVLCAGMLVALAVLAAWRREPAAAAGAALLAAATAAPALFPWYLAWGAPCVVAADRPRLRRTALVALAAVSLLALPSVVHAP